MLSFVFYGLYGIAGSTLVYGVGKYIRRGREKEKNDVPLPNVYMASDGSPRYMRNHIGLPIDEEYDYNTEEALTTRL